MIIVRCTDLKENAQVFLPKAVDAKTESELNIIRNIILEEFDRYKKEIENRNENIKRKNKKDNEKKRENEKVENKKPFNNNQEWMNMTNKERKGLRKLRKKKQKGEIVIWKSDKSGRLVAIKKNYLMMGTKQNGKDSQISRKELLKIEETLNDRIRMLSKAMNIGENHSHLSRILASKITNSEYTAPKY